MLPVLKSKLDFRNNFCLQFPKVFLYLGVEVTVHVFVINPSFLLSFYREKETHH